ncbi:ABC transporter substrate-binding protein [Lysinibacillus sp. 2017]|uniref:transporter substrate-binding domain-containing protein n=1 Tax=unclassified Lysinibacillus TaxID=2636778 RepID=UPI000D52769E|nr:MULTISPECIES: transporter substrate-binding domain-containing protein [unclassified Lysinibacillus]AWE06166.1 ABC transporter substrate-binding protein [Lysinibacillus sp. 2017]TGN35179.1 transporter substrate-binding domain-containing protein [Lysinibacillus sp. S2017]
MKKKFLLALLTTMVIAVLAACGASDEKETSTGSEGTDSGDKKTLVVGTSADYAPFEYVETATSDEIIGFDIDLIKLVGEKLGYDIKVQNMDFNSLITALQSKKFDVVISGMTPTEERDEVVDFSIPYYETEQYMIFDKEKGYKTPADIKGGVVGAQISSIQEDLAKELGEEHGFKVESRNLIPELVQELKTGRFDAAVIENIVSENYLSQNADLAAFPIEVEDPDYKAIVFQEGSDLKAEFDKVIEELTADGTIEELKTKWFVVE